MDRPPATAQFRRASIALAAVLGVAVIAGGIWLGSRDDDATPGARDTAAAGATPAATDAASDVEATTTAASPAFEQPESTFGPATEAPPRGRLTEATPLPDAPEGTKGWKVSYSSTLRDGTSMVVTGLVYAPDKPAPAGGWPVLSYAHPTVGLADACAPTTNIGLLETTISSLFTASDMVVVMTDYPGLGTPGPHPFLDGVSSGNSVLDIASAARAIEGLDLSTTTVILGHSQGGHAALWAGQLATTYAPDLNVVGVVAGAPPSQFSTFITDLANSPRRGYVPLVASGLQPLDPTLQLSDVLTEDGLALAERLETECSSVIDDAPTPMLKGTALPADWQAALDANEPGTSKIGSPVLIFHGDADDLVPIATSEVLAAQLEGLGTSVERKVYPGANHTFVVLAALGDITTWVTARITDTAAASAGGSTTTRPPASGAGERATTTPLPTTTPPG